MRKIIFGCIIVAALLLTAWWANWGISRSVVPDVLSITDSIKKKTSSDLAVGSRDNLTMATKDYLYGTNLYKSQGKNGGNSLAYHPTKALMDIINSATDEKLAEYKADIHIEWMTTVESILGERLTDEKKKAIRQNHLLFLYAVDELENEYLRNHFSHDAWKAYLMDLHNWNDAFYRNLLSDEEYQLLFNEKKGNLGEAVKAIISPIPELHISNRQTTLEEVYRQVPESKINKIIALNKEKKLKEKFTDVTDMPIEEFKQEFDRRNREYYKRIRQILTPYEFQLIFGENLDAKYK